MTHLHCINFRTLQLALQLAIPIKLDRLQKDLHVAELVGKGSRLILWCRGELKSFDEEEQFNESDSVIELAIASGFSTQLGNVPRYSR